MTREDPKAIRRRILENARDGVELYKGCGNGKGLARAQYEMIEAIAKGWIVRTGHVEDAKPAFKLTDLGREEFGRLHPGAKT